MHPTPNFSALNTRGGHCVGLISYPFPGPDQASRIAANLDGALSRPPRARP
jgi:hypothetical protein